MMQRRYSLELSPNRHLDSLSIVLSMVAPLSLNGDNSSSRLDWQGEQQAERQVGRRDFLSCVSSYTMIHKIFESNNIMTQTQSATVYLCSLAQQDSFESERGKGRNKQPRER